jgi:hypothetical protein
MQCCCRFCLDLVGHSLKSRVLFDHCPLPLLCLFKREVVLGNHVISEYQDCGSHCADLVATILP